MFTAVFWVMLAMAVADWVATSQDWKRIRWVTKPGTLILLIAWFSQVGEWRLPLAWFGLGLVLSLAGDVLLMLPQRFFLGGLVSFLLAHVAYIAGFGQQAFVLGWGVGLPVLLVSGAFVALNGQIRAGLKRSGETGMQVPVMLYAGVISVMWLMAFTTLFRPDWQLAPAALVCLGAGLFFVSDSLLAFNRFVRPVTNGHVAVMVSYHLAQIFITMGVLMQYVG